MPNADVRIDQAAALESPEAAASFVVPAEDLSKGDPVFPDTWARWRSDNDATDADDLRLGAAYRNRPGTAIIDVPRETLTGGVRLWGLIPSDRWPLPGRPALQGIQGGMSMELESSGHDVGGTDYSLIKSNDLNPIIASDPAYGTITWWR